MGDTLMPADTACDRRVIIGGMPYQSHLSAAANAAENLLALCEARRGWSYRHEDYVIADVGNRGCRVVITRPSADPAAAISRMTELAAEHMPGRPLVVEDTFGTLPLEHYGFTPWARIPVMVRDARTGAADCIAGTGAARERTRATGGDQAAGSIRVAIATSPADVNTVERLMVDCLPLTSLQPWRPGVLFPPDPARIPGWVMWLGLRDCGPAGCCATFDDGHMVGLYGMAVVPAMRRRGVGSTLLEAVFDYYPGRTSCLTATTGGFWLYASAGYRTVGLATWWGSEPA